MVDIICTKKGGVKLDSGVTLLEGTQEKGPWYRKDQFDEDNIKLLEKKGWIEDRRV